MQSLPWSGSVGCSFFAHNLETLCEVRIRLGVDVLLISMFRPKNAKGCTKLCRCSTKKTYAQMVWTRTRTWSCILRLGFVGYVFSIVSSQILHFTIIHIFRISLVLQRTFLFRRLSTNNQKLFELRYSDQRHLRRNRNLANPRRSLTKC